MRFLNILLTSVLLLSGCSFTATEGGDDSGGNLVAIGSITASPTDTLPIPSSTPSPGGIEGERILMGSECLRSISSLREYQASFELPEELYQETGVELPIENGIDVSQYFSYLDHLNMEDGYSLGYVYFADIVGGRPLVYAHPSSQPAYSTYEEFSQAIGGNSSDQYSFSPLENAFEYLTHIRNDDSPEGFFQLAALSLMGDQFYLFWHALYHDEVILCGVGDVELIREAIGSIGSDVSEEVLQAASALDLEPFVILGDEAAVVRFAYFTKWGGVEEAFLTINRSFPHEILDVDVNPLVEYDCGIMF